MTGGAACRDGSGELAADEARIAVPGRDEACDTHGLHDDGCRPHAPLEGTASCMRWSRAIPSPRLLFEKETKARFAAAIARRVSSASARRTVPMTSSVAGQP
jgi:hypothetical protein